MPTKSVAKRLFDSVLAKNHTFFLNEARWHGRRLENKTPRETINMDGKTELKI